ncbi:substrate-binding domain-containing protein [Saccharothrix sp. 6-C]|uniref:Ribose transport system substrate-binding protein n=1 Tax=Saccharothrix texasensis TaxID=103734 RepID=A0A3N1H085_9PSEU|nr:MULTISPECIES: substrate-binding domain-containing protein [Saccharothrix]QQQ79390.1 substrate-binding domain-containing protein [Saccharothrix sp. 6-C]ROP35796.1 ribose transport system substrate-binding protein [Saccharothrix texasensis]
MNRKWSVVAVAGLLAMAGCSSDLPADTGTPGTTGASKDAGAKSEFFDQALYERQTKSRSTAAEGPADKPWEQMISPELVDTAKFAKPGGDYHLCFSNAAVNNPWRQVGFTTMKEEVKLHPEITKFTVLDAEAKDDKQISDIQSFASQGCSALIVSPNTTATLTPAIEAACKTNVPVIVFDRGVNSTCPVTFIHPIGGFAFGADGAEFLKEKVKAGGKVLALRILPGVDVLEQRWAAANEIFSGSELKVVGVEFTDGDAAKTKSIVNDYIQREGQIDGVWMDAGATAVAAVEAFQDAGVPIPAFVGEDQQDFLRMWADQKMTAVAPTYPTYQWRTPVIAALQVLNGRQVPKEWVLPQPKVTQDTLQSFLRQDMPPLHYAMCGCESMAGYPAPWK